MEVKDVIDDLKFCKMQMDRLLNLSIEMSKMSYLNDKHTVIQSDIIRLRRDLNNVRKKLEG